MEQVDSEVTHDHTYYGNGNTSHSGISTSGNARIQTTADSETQSIGTYFNFQAATSSTGGSLSANNSIAPDSFCPSGWQLPYSGDGGNYYNGSKSFYYLIVTKYAYGDNSTGSEKITSYPLSYLFSGDYQWTNGKLYNQGAHGRQRTNTVRDSSDAYSLAMLSTHLLPQYSYTKHAGYSMR